MFQIYTIKGKFQGSKFKGYTYNNQKNTIRMILKKSQVIDIFYI